MRRCSCHIQRTVALDARRRLTYHEDGRRADDRRGGCTSTSRPIHTVRRRAQNFGADERSSALQDAGVATAGKVLRSSRRKLDGDQGHATAKERTRCARRRPTWLVPSLPRTAKDLQSERAQRRLRVDRQASSTRSSEAASSRAFDHRVLRRVPHGQDAAVHDAVRDVLSPAQPRRRRGLYASSTSIPRAPSAPSACAALAARYDLDHDFLMENVMTTRVTTCGHARARRTPRACLPAARRATRAAKTSLSRACRLRAASTTVRPPRGAPRPRGRPLANEGRLAAACSSSTRSSRCTGSTFCWGCASTQKRRAAPIPGKVSRWSRTSPRSSCVTQPPRARDAPAVAACHPAVHEAVCVLRSRASRARQNVAAVLPRRCARPRPYACTAFVQDAKKAVGGHVLAHIVDTRVVSAPRISTTTPRARAE